LVGASASLADGAFDDRPFCGFESGCEAVPGTAYGKPLGVPLAAVGVVGFAGLFALTLFPVARAFALVVPLAVAAGAVGAALLAVQAIILNRYCALCVFTDVAAIVAGALALRVRRAAVA